ncbi:hypothetical protein LA080_005434 [Diaporthe eres]|nr:hypothetical protein LA080_005434 [Diaporthe eres]
MEEQGNAGILCMWKWTGGVYVPGGEGISTNADIILSVNNGAPANTVILFLYLLIVLTLALICWLYAAEVYCLVTRAAHG